VDEPKGTETEIGFVASAILSKVFQSDQAKLGLALHCARVAVAAHWQWGDGEAAKIEREAAP